MNKLIAVFVLFFVVIGQVLASSVDTVRVSAIGKIVVYKPEQEPVALVIFVSGDGGWDKSMIKMAGYLVKEGAIVAGIDIKQYLKINSNNKHKCFYPAGDFELLSLKLQKKYKLTHYMKPILVGYSSGATLIYGTLAQSPGNTFKGAIALGFCPDIEIDKTFCNGSGLISHSLPDKKGYYLEASKKLTAPFVVLLGAKDQVCSVIEVQKYMQEISSGELIQLPKVGHGFSVTRRWQPQYIAAYQKILQAPSFAEQKANQNKLLQEQHLEPLPGNIPLSLIPSAKADSLPLAFVVSGDGG
jgi:type IV secretory pathway VirJ component